ncbi:tetratricopeptide repeat protein [Fibrobacterota bacterium]
MSAIIALLTCVFFNSVLSAADKTDRRTPSLKKKEEITSLGLGLLPPRLIAATGKHLWIGSAMEERFYQAGKFAGNFFVPQPAQLNQLLRECPFEVPKKCQEMVGNSLNLTLLAEIKYKVVKNNYKARIIIHHISDTSLSKTMYTQVPVSEPFQFISRTLLKVFESIAVPDHFLLKELHSFPTVNITAYGCYALGYRYVAQSRFKEAFYPLLRAMELDPVFPNPLVQLGRAFLLTGRIDSALQIVEKHSVRKSSWELELLRAEILLKKGKHEQAFIALKSAEKMIPERTSDLEYAFGKYYKSISSASRGISYVIAAINLNPSVLEYYLTLGELFFITREYQSAIPYFEKLTRLAPSNKYYKLYYAIALRENNQIGMAIDLLKEVLESHPDFFPARVNLGIVYYRLGWFQKAEKAFQANIELHQDTMSSAMNLAVLKIKSGNMNQGEKLLEQVLDYQPDSYQTLVNLGMVETRNGKYAEAEKHLKKALEKGGTDTTILLALAEVYGYQKKTDREFELLNKTLEIDPENITALTRLAQYSQRNNEYSEAINYLMEVIDLNPAAYQQRLMLARCLLQVNDRVAGLKQLEFVADNFTHSPEIQIVLAQSYFENRLYGSAITTAEPLLHQKADRFECHLILGKAFTEQIIQNQNRRPNAEELAGGHLVKAVMEKPEDWRGHYWLGRFQRRVRRDHLSAKKSLERSLNLALSGKDKELVKRELSNLSL